MNEPSSKDFSYLNSFDKMWMDSLLSLQPVSTYVEAWNAIPIYDDSKIQGISNEKANELFVHLNGEVRGVVYVEERDQYVVFLNNKDGGEIGIINEKDHSYKKITDSVISPELGICQDEFIDATVKVVQPCNNLYLYWSSGDIYKRLNLDDPCCKFEEIQLIKPIPIGSIKVKVLENAGGLPNGIYRYAARARDIDGNVSNCSYITNPKSISGGDNKPGERSNKAIELQIQGSANRDYHLLDLFAIITIDGFTTIEYFATISSSSDNGVFNYLYTGKTGDETVVSLSTILNRTNRYIRGKNLVQYDDRLILYNLHPVANLDYQRQANNIKVKYKNYILPIERAHNFKGLMHDENYLFSIGWNYIDNTSSRPFVISGEEGGPGTCDPYKDTSKRLNTYIDIEDLVFDKDISVGYDPGSDFTGDTLTEDEGTAVTLDPENDMPTMGDDINNSMQEVDYASFEMTDATDCLCEFAQKLATSEGGGGGGWDLDDDLIGAVALGQLLCMCANRTVSLEGDDGGASTSIPEEEVENGEEEIDKEYQPIISSFFSGKNKETLEKLGVDTDLTFEEAGITDDDAKLLLKSLESSCLGGDCVGGTNTVFSSKGTGSSCSNNSCSKCGSSCDGNTGCSNSSCSASSGYLPSDNIVTGRKLERPVDFFRNRIAYENQMLQKDIKVANTEELESKSVFVGGKCNKEGYRNCVSNICYECKNGKWYHINNLDIYDVGTGFTAVVSGGDSGGSGKEYNALIANPTKKSVDLSFEYEYSEDGCTVVGIKPKVFSDGLFGAWEIEELYPETLNCECEYIYGDLAGKKVRLHKVPSITKEPHFISFSSGVPSEHDQGNSEFKDSYVLMIGPEFSGIVPPANPPKPLNPLKPYTIYYAERTESNKTVLGTAVAHSCFLGEIAGEKYAFPKHAVNSFERFDRHIEPSGVSTFRGGTRIDVGAYILHSPDLHMRGPSLEATECLFEMELYGKGYRHGTMAKGEIPSHMSQDTLHQKGTRQALSLNKYLTPSEPIVRTVKALQDAPADCIVGKGNKFKYNLCNLHRESSTYMEVDGGLQTFIKKDSDRKMTGKYGGSDNIGDNASDRSFTGDIFTDALPIHDVRAHLVTLIRKLPHQYGSLINQAYIPLGLEANGMTDTVSGLVGDSFNNYVTYKRTGLVSDKTNRIISRFVSVNGFADPDDSFVKRLIGNLLAYMFRALGVKNGGYIPKNQDASDYIRVFGGLRDVNDSVTNNILSIDYPGEISEGKIPPPYPKNRDKEMNKNRIERANDINFGDNYFPQNLKSQISTYIPSDTNVAYRQINNVEGGEVYYSSNSNTLRGLRIDSSIGDGPWKKGWLNRWYSEWKENAKWKLLAQGILLFLFTYMIGLWIMFKGVGYVVTGLQAIGGGMYGMQTIGALLAASFGIVLIFVGAKWIGYWVTSDLDNKLVEELIGLKNMRPDKKNSDGSYSFDENRLMQFENNYWKYDGTHSMVNNLEVLYGMSDPYNTCSCKNMYTNEILYSNKQIPMSGVDSWCNFKPNNNLSIPLDRGNLKKIFQLGGKLYAHTTDMLMSIEGSKDRFDIEGLKLGTGDLFGGVASVFGGVVEGYAGLSDPNAAQVCAYGYIFPDRKSRRWYTFMGEIPVPISNMGVRNFMNNNMALLLLDYFPDFKLVDLKLDTGIGYSFGVDYENERLLFSKRDFIPISKDIKLNDDKVSFSLNGKNIAIGDPEYFINKSYTLSYFTKTKSWVSFHNYIPHLYLWNRYNMYTFNNEGLWLHNVEGKFQTFYGVHYPFSVEYSVNYEDAFVFGSTILDTEAYVYKKDRYIYKPQTFDKVIAYNSHQVSGLRDFVVNDDMDIVQRSVENDEVVKLDYKNRIWTYSGITDKIIDENDFIFDNATEVGPKPLNNNNIDKDHIKNNIFYDNYLVNRLIFSKFDDLKLILKKVQTKVSYKSR